MSANRDHQQPWPPFSKEEIEVAYRLGLDLSASNLEQDGPKLFLYTAGENCGGDCDYFHNPVEAGSIYVAAEYPDGMSYTVSKGFASYEEAELYLRGAQDLLKYRAEQSRNGGR